MSKLNHCQVCHIQFEVTAGSKGICCSRACVAVYNSKLLKERSNSTNASKKDEYGKHPNKCLECSSTLPFEKRKNQFCNSSCAGAFNSRGRIRTDESKAKVAETIKAKIAQGELTPPTRVSRPKTRVSYITCVSCNKQAWVKHGLKCCTIECARSYTIRNGIKSKQHIHNGVALDSSWESTLAHWLDNHNIEWIRPKHLLYVLDDKPKKYFPDFYLPKYNLYLDPKNPYRLKIDLRKMQVIEKQVTILYGDLSYIISHLETLSGLKSV